MNERIRSIVFPSITFVVLALTWHYSVVYFQVPAYILPLPMDVLSTMVNGFVRGNYFDHFLFTLTTTLLGFAIGSMLALVLGAAVAESRTFEQFLYPYVVALQAMPKVALAPLVLVWFGFGMESKVVLIVLICFFPLFINTIVGIRQVDPDLVQMARAFSMSPAYIFFHIKLPAAGSHIFAGLQIGMALSLIGAIVAEFVSSERGLGYLIGSATVTMSVSTMFAGVLILSIMGILATILIRSLHIRILFWEDHSGQL